MKRKWAALAALLAVLLAASLLAGCGSAKKQSDVTDKEMVGKVTGESRNVKVGEEFAIELVSNPTTGYEWKMTGKPDAAILGLTTDEFVAPESSAAGAPGMHVFRFKALKAGDTNMVFEYARSWETEKPPAQTHNVSVAVQ